MPERNVAALTRVWRIMNEAVPNFHMFPLVLNFRRKWLEAVIKQSTGASFQSYVARAWAQSQLNKLLDRATEGLWWKFISDQIGFFVV